MHNKTVCISHSVWYSVGHTVTVRGHMTPNHFCDRVSYQNIIKMVLQWNLYKATTHKCGLSRQVLSHEREKNIILFKYCARWMTQYMSPYMTFPVALDRFHCT